MNANVPMLIVHAGLAICVGCSSVHASSIPAGPASAAVDASRVTLARTWTPENAVLVATVTVDSYQEGGIEPLIEAFRAEVAARGGNFGKIDVVRGSWEMRRSSRTDYEHEARMLHITGRAFRVESAP